MKSLLILFLASLALGIEFAITQEYIEYLKLHATWEVEDYENSIFRGWTVEEFEAILNPEEEFYNGEIPQEDVIISDYEVDEPIDWSNANCLHEIRNQGSCGSCWAFSVAGMVSDRCCLKKTDHGWLSPQELVSCDKQNSGCNGGIRDLAIDYVVKNGLVPDACFPYIAKDSKCPSKCADGKDWKAAHTCKCSKRINCQGKEPMIACLKTGPISTGFLVYSDFMTYKSGIYHKTKGAVYRGGHAVKCIGYGTDPEPYYHCANSWGASWGDKGYFKIGVGECGIDTRQPGYCDPA